jgi:2-oxoisovalerate dehydrogenase E1 component
LFGAATAHPHPTVLIEHRSLYQQSGEVSTGGAGQRAEGARLHRSGADVTILTWGAILGDVLTAAEQLAAEGIEATVVDLRWLRPLDDATIAQAVAASSGRVLVVHEATTSGGFGAEVAARITEQHFDTLTGPVRRLGSPDTRIPSAPVLQDALRPSVAGIVAAARAVAGADRVPAGLAG